MRTVLEQSVGRFIEEGTADCDIQIAREHAEPRLLLQGDVALTADQICGRYAQLQRGMQHGLETQIAHRRGVHRVGHLQTGEHDAQSRFLAATALQQLDFGQSAHSYLDEIAFEHVPFLQMHQIADRVVRGRLPRKDQLTPSRVAEQKPAARFTRRPARNLVETSGGRRSVLQIEHECGVIVAEGEHVHIPLGLNSLELKGQSLPAHVGDRAVVLFIRQLVQNPRNLAIEIELSSHLEAFPRVGLLPHHQAGPRDHLEIVVSVLDRARVHQFAIHIQRHLEGIGLDRNHREALSRRLLRVLQRRNVNGGGEHQIMVRVGLGHLRDVAHDAGQHLRWGFQGTRQEGGLREGERLRNAQIDRRQIAEGGVNHLLKDFKFQKIVVVLIEETAQKLVFSGVRLRELLIVPIDSADEHVHNQLVGMEHCVLVHLEAVHRLVLACEQIGRRELMERGYRDEGIRNISYKE